MNITSRALLAVPVLLLAVACGAGNDAGNDADTASSLSADAGAPAGEPAAPDAPEALPREAQDSALTVGGDAGSKAESAPAAVSRRAVISTGQISLEGRDLEEARFSLQKLLGQWGGEIADEESSADDKGRTRTSRLTLRVPSDHFDEAMTEIAEIDGTRLVDRSRSSEDVTTQVIDNAARVRSQKLSLARVQALLAKAKDLNQIIAIESQLSQRQAELDSLEQQQKYLADQTALSTIELYLAVPDDSAPAEDEDDGFLSGLEAGWDNLGKATTAVLTAIGAVLPFALVLALLGVPAWLGWKRRVSAR